MAQRHLAPGDIGASFEFPDHVGIVRMARMDTKQVRLFGGSNAHDFSVGVVGIQFHPLRRACADVALRADRCKYPLLDVGVGGIKCYRHAPASADRIAVFIQPDSVPGAAGTK